MFNYLSKYKKIIVVGSQRSGTTIAAQMIADDLEYDYVDETRFHVKDYRIIRDVYLKKYENIVLQAPAVTTQIHNLVNPDVLVVFMERNHDDIIKSMKKITGGVCGSCGREYGFELNVKQHEKILKKYRQHPISKKDNPEMKSIYSELTESDKTTVDILYSMWHGFQKHNIDNTMELQYESLSKHRMWIPKEKRENFHKKQTGFKDEVGKEFGGYHQ